MQGQRKIAVAGATGRLGRHIVDVLEEGERAGVQRIVGGVDHRSRPGHSRFHRVLPGPNAVLAGPTFEQWLSTRLATT